MAIQHNIGPDDYEQLQPAETDRVRLRFSGKLEGEPVMWDATLLTLERVYRESGRRGGELRNFIEVGNQGPDGLRITVGLNVARIDTPTIKMAIMMIRQYKRLRPGRHEYGEARRFA